MILCPYRSRSRLGPGGATAVATLIALITAGRACAQSGAPVTGGGLAPNGRSALLAQHIWEDETNAKGGMLGRPVNLIHYDDKSSPSENAEHSRRHRSL
jgi:branched-chain amino acid transport system substrate-binding protein